MKLAKLPHLIVLCTTMSPEDEILVRIAQRNSICYFQGSEKDILDRYLKAALKYKVVEVFIQTGKVDFIVWV